MHPFLSEARSRPCDRARFQASPDRGVRTTGRTWNSYKPTIAVLGADTGARTWYETSMHWGTWRWSVIRRAQAGNGHRAYAGRSPSSEKFDDASERRSGQTLIAIATPATTHYALAKAALVRERMSSSRSRFASIKARARSWSDWPMSRVRVLMVGHLLQYHPCVRALHSLVAPRRDLGKLHYITSQQAQSREDSARGERAVEFRAARHLRHSLAAGRPVARAGHVARVDLPEPRRRRHDADRPAIPRTACAHTYS